MQRMQLTQTAVIGGWRINWNGQGHKFNDCWILKALEKNFVLVKIYDPFISTQNDTIAE
jgi:hypothetical protein